MEKIKGIIISSEDTALIYYKNSKKIVHNGSTRLFPLAYDIIYNSKKPEGIYKVSGEDNINCQISLYKSGLNFLPSLDVKGDVYIEVIKDGIDYKYRFISALKYYDSAFL